VTATQANLAWETLFDLSRTRPGPLHVRLAAAIRTAIRDGRLPSGAALPPSRMLAARLGVSRWTVTQAYGHLITEGYLTGRTGSATRVSWAPGPADELAARSPQSPSLSVSPAPTGGYDMLSYRPALREFPRRRWAEAIGAVTETVPSDQLDYSEPGGLPELRAVLAEHLNRTRGAVVTPATISVFSGAGQALTQLARALRADGHTAVGMENPGSPRLWQAVELGGLRYVDVPVDDDGLVVEALADYPELRAVCVGTARQIAFGFPLAPGRRRALLDWAAAVDGLIIEDDYDAEFSERPAPPTMQGTSPDRVALLGSMTHAVGPAVNIGWVVTPGRWVDAVRAEHEMQILPPALNQLALVHLMRTGAYARHLRSTRQIIQARRARLAAALERGLPGCRVLGQDGGLHLVVELPPGADPDAIVAAAERRGVHLCSLDGLRIRPDPARPGLLIGYGNLRDSSIEDAVAALAAAFAESA
jgi:GntR family transcriptional regulator / MocR family aminotransferase